MPSLSINAAASHTESTTIVSYHYQARLARLLSSSTRRQRGAGRGSLTALIVSEAKLSADLLVEGDHEDFGGVHGNFAKLLFKDLLCGALDHVFQEETVSLCERVGPPHRIWLFGLRRCLSALTARANLFLLLLH